VVGTVPVEVYDNHCGAQLSECMGDLPPHPLPATEHKVSASGEVEPTAVIDDPVEFGAIARR
jgi:hypothetical protein